MSETVEIFSYAACPYAQRSRLVLLEKSIPFALTEIDLANKPDWFLALSPYGKVPCIRHRGQVFYESAIINEYLDEAFGEVPLMPGDPAGRARARIWIDAMDSRLSEATRQVMRSDGKDDKARQQVIDTLHFIEREGLAKLSDGPYWLGETVSLIDLHYWPFIERWPGIAENWDLPIPDSCPRLLRWIAAMAERDSVKATRLPAERHIETWARMAKRMQQAA